RSPACATRSPLCATWSLACARESSPDPGERPFGVRRLARTTAIGARPSVRRVRTYAATISATRRMRSIQLRRPRAVCIAAGERSDSELLSVIDLDQAPSMQGIAQLAQVQLDRALRLLVAVGQGHGGGAHGRRSLELLEHAAARRVEPVVAAGLEVEHDRLGREAAIDDVLGHLDARGQQGYVGCGLRAHDRSSTVSGLVLDDRRAPLAGANGELQRV